MMRATLSTCALLLALSSPLYAAPSLPASGMSMQAVESQFGQPLKKNPAVGRPPITRWEYAGFVVVFERSTVINSMYVERAGATAPAPTPAAKPAAQAPANVAPAPAPTAPVPPASAAPAPTVAPAPAPAAAPVAPAPTTPADDAQAAMARAAAEKAAAEKAAADKSQAAPAEAAPANDNYTFDPETGRIIIK